MTPEELQAIKERCEKATPGEWRDILGDSYNAYPTIIVPDGHEVTVYVMEKGEMYPGKNSDASFIAHARQDVPALLEEIIRLKKQVNEQWCGLPNLGGTAPYPEEWEQECP